MAFEPSSKVYLLQVPLEISNNYQIDFLTEGQQRGYFESKRIISFSYDDFTYIRKDNIIRVPVHIDKLWNCNYVMYQNSNFTDKWFYCFIINKKYIGDECTEITIKTDVYQTWMFNYNILPSFVAREMVDISDDLRSKNLEAEGLETGEYITASDFSATDIQWLKPAFIIAYGRNPYVDGFTTHRNTEQGIVINGMPSGIFYCACGKDGLLEVLNEINTAGYGDSIISVFSVPICAIAGLKEEWTLSYLWTHNSYHEWIMSNFKSDEQYVYFNSIHGPSDFKGYTPRNKKLLQYPYNYFGFNPQNGSPKIFRYEDFEIPEDPQENHAFFKLISEINPNPSIYFLPLHFKNQTDVAVNEAVALSGYPSISWTTDFYNTWLAQNSGIIDIQMRQEQFNYEVDSNLMAMKSIGSIGSKINLANPIGSGISSGLETVSSGIQLQKLSQNHGEYINMMMAQKEKQQMLPNSASLGSSNSTLLGYDYIWKDIFSFYQIKREFAEKIDLYFDMYGYAINKLKIPNTRNRPKWNYIKTVNIAIDSGAPQEDIDELKELFNTGLTIWHDPNTFGDYSQNNR